MRISDWSSDVCSSDLHTQGRHASPQAIVEYRHTTYCGYAELLVPEKPTLSVSVAYSAQAQAGRFVFAITTSAPHARMVWPTRLATRTAERRVGKKCFITGMSRWSPDNYKKNKN